MDFGATEHRNQGGEETETEKKPNITTYLLDCTGGVAYGTPRNASIGRRNL